MNNAVTNWFGTEFTQLHPLLQTLHQKGGQLSGVVTLEYGRGLAGFLGKVLASKMGLPIKTGEYNFKVIINHTSHCFYWNRVFANTYNMNSTFVPYGYYPHGYWEETTGKLAIQLGVEIIDGGWYWKPRSLRFMGLPLPLVLFPQPCAYKTIRNNKYHFFVSFSLPLLGTLISYHGDLIAQALKA